jgi:hypothetical protein
MKPTKTYNMSKTTKRMLATMTVGAKMKSEWKASMIQAELHQAMVPKMTKRERSSPEE